MGREIGDSDFSEADYRTFQQRLERETGLLCELIDGDGMTDDEPMAGFELEAWLVDHQGRPAPLIEPLREKLNDPLLVPELAAFNLELNGTPVALTGAPFTRLHDELSATWRRTADAARQLGANLTMIGSLPSAEAADFCLANMSPMQRYTALNTRVLELRGGQPIQLDIQGRDHLRVSHDDVMLEAAATAFQLHLKVPARRAGRVFNASKILSGPMVALGANSPYLFGAELWDETRVPLFEQAVDVGGSTLTKRVDFGIRYIHKSISEVFQANLHRYPVLLPHRFEEPEHRFAHLSLHNGTIWRWNRPIVGFDDDGAPHVRIEHRVLPSGPTLIDAIANAALYYGAVHMLSTRKRPPEASMPFATCSDNFYAAARHGLRADNAWLGGKHGSVRELLRKQLLPLAHEGLEQLAIDAQERNHWLGIIQARLDAATNGSDWQRRWVEKHGHDMPGLTRAYLERQQSGQPVHLWSL